MNKRNVCAIAMISSGFVFSAMVEEQLSLSELMNIEIVGVSKYKEKLSETPMSVYNLTSQEMERWGVRYLNEALQRTPGFSFYNTDYYGQYGVMARGWQSVWRYGMSIELMPMVDFGHHSFPSAFYKSIEIARGPAGLAWGSGANAGLMNAQLRDDIEGVEIVGELGNWDRENLTVMFGSVIDEDEGDMVLVGVNSMEQGTDEQQNASGVPGHKYKTNGWLPSYATVGKVKYGDVKFLFFHEQALHVQPDMHFAPSYVKDESGKWVPTPERIAWDSISAINGHETFDQMEMTTYRAEYHLPVMPNNMELFFYHNFYKRLWQQEGIADFGDRQRDLGFNLNMRFLDDNLIANVGGDLYSDFQYNSVAVNHSLAVELSEGGLDWWGTVYAPTDVISHNLFAQVSYRTPIDLMFILGGRIDYTEDDETGFFENFDDKSLITGPRLGLVYSPLDNLTAKYLYNRAPRAPISNEARPHSLTGKIADPEILDAHEIALFYTHGNSFDGNLTLFRQELTNQITRDPESFNDFTNTGGLLNLGVEWALKYKPVHSVLLYSNGSYSKPEIQTEGGLESTEPHSSDDRPLFVPALTTIVGTEYTFKNILRINVAERFIDDIPYVDLNEKEKTASVLFTDFTMGFKPLNLMREAPLDLDISFVALNALDNDDPVPAYGEHAKNQNGSISPEGRRWYVKAKMSKMF